ncbi:MAG: nuclear transport factor 2 family protein [Sphingomonadales bacterium]
MNDTEQRLHRAESILAIKALTHRYSNLCDRGFDPDRISALFVDDGVWDGGPAVGRFEGRGAIRDFLAGLATVVTWSGHFVVNDEFEVNGGAASGLWRCIAVVNNPGAGPVMDNWYFQDYHFECVEMDGAWKFRSIRTDLRKTTGYLPDIAGHSPVVR